MTDQDPTLRSAYPSAVTARVRMPGLSSPGAIPSEETARLDRPLPPPPTRLAAMLVGLEAGTMGGAVMFAFASESATAAAWVGFAIWLRLVRGSLRR